MLAETRIADADPRLVLPKVFANITVIIHRASETDLRIRRETVNGDVEFPFAEESADVPLAYRDRQHFLAVIGYRDAHSRTGLV